MHRSRLFAQHLPEFGWEPIVLTVDEKYYEEALDWNLFKLLPKVQRIEKAKAFRITKPRLIGDIGLRAFFQLRKKARQLVESEKIDFVYIPIPSFYVSLIGPWLHRKTGVRYGIDYIDPWVHYFPGSEKVFSRHWISTKIAKWLEPIAVKTAVLITGVAEGYYKGVIERNSFLLKNAVFVAMPYGGEEQDHTMVKILSLKPYLFSTELGIIQLLYAGAMLPKAYGPLRKIFEAISSNMVLYSNIKIHFIGTGKSANDEEGFNIKPLAIEYGLWQNIVFEYPARIPYLDVLVHLNEADGVLILGSTEPHYTPSKVYQGVLSKKPIAAILHAESSACEFIKQSNAGVVLDFKGEDDLHGIKDKFNDFFQSYLNYLNSYDPKKVNKVVFDKFSARSVTEMLAKKLDELIT